MLVVMFAVGGSAIAQTLTWNGLQTQWHAAGSWSPFPGGPPTGNNIARFDLNITDTVEWNNTTGNRTADQLHILAGTYTLENTVINNFQLTLDSGLANAFRVTGAGTTLNIDGLNVTTLLSSGLIGNGATLNIRDGLIPTINGRLTCNGALVNNGNLSALAGAVVSSEDGLISFPLGTGSTNFAGANTRWDITNDLMVGNATNSGSLTVEQGAAVNLNGGGLIRGSASVRNAELNANSVTVGSGGAGILLVDLGGQTTVTNNVIIGNSPLGLGEALISGANSGLSSTNIFVAGNGDGMLTIENGGSIANSGNFLSADSPGTLGISTITGTGSHLDCNFMIAGLDGFGIVDVVDGGSIDCLGITLAAEAVGLGSLGVSGNGSQVTCLNATIGDSGEGGCTLGNGALFLVNNDMHIAPFVGSSGLIQAGLGGQLMVMNDLFVGGNGETLGGVGLLRLSTSGSIQVGNELRIFADSLVEMGNGLLSANNAWQNDGLIRITGIAEIDGTGTISADGEVAQLGGVFLPSSCSFNGNISHLGAITTPAQTQTVFQGQFTGDGSFAGSGDVVFNGNLRPGVDPSDTEILEFEGSVQLGSGSATHIQLGGVGNGQHDRLQLDGDLQLGGGLFVSTVGGHTVQPGNSYVIADFGGDLTGQFNGLVEGASVGNFDGVNLIIAYDLAAKQVRLQAQAGVLLGDVNLDGEVNLLDVQPFVNRVTTGTFQAEADINQDGVVDLLDIQPFVELLF